MNIKISATTAMYLSIYAIEPAMERLAKDAKELDEIKRRSTILDISRNHYRDVLEAFTALNLHINQELQELDNLMKRELENYNNTQQQ